MNGATRDLEERDIKYHVKKFEINYIINEK